MDKKVKITLLYYIGNKSIGGIINLALRLLFIFQITYLTAQPSIEWQKALGGSEIEEIYSVQQSADGGYIMVGYTYSNNGDVTGFKGGIDAWVVKLSETGFVQWKKTYGGTDIDWAYDVKQTSDQGYILAGYTSSTNGDVTGNHGGKDAWLVKINDTGIIQWQKSLGGSGWDEAWAVQTTTDGGYIVAGRSNSQNGDLTENHGGLDYWIIKLNNVGTIEWQKSLGGSAEDNAYAVKQTSDGGYIIAGESLSQNGDVTNNHGDADYWVVKLSNAGSIEWQNSFGGSGLDRANDISVAEDGGFVVIGHTSSNNGDVEVHYSGFDIWAVKMNASGEMVWQKTLGGSDQDWGEAIQKTIDGGYIIAGSTWSTDGDVHDDDSTFDMWVIKLSDEGVLQWQKTLGGTKGEDAFSISQTSDEGYIVSGTAFSNDGDVSGLHAKSDYWIVKLSPASVGLNELFSDQPGLITVFPNPAQQSIFLQVPSEEISLSVSISDVMGKEISFQNIQHAELLDISVLPKGLFLVKARTPSGGIFMGKFIKE